MPYQHVFCGKWILLHFRILRDEVQPRSPVSRMLFSELWSQSFENQQLFECCIAQLRRRDLCLRKEGWEVEMDKTETLTKPIKRSKTGSQRSPPWMRRKMRPHSGIWGALVFTHILIQHSLRACKCQVPWSTGNMNLLWMGQNCPCRKTDTGKKKPNLEW